MEELSLRTSSLSDFGDCPRRALAKALPEEADKYGVDKYHGNGSIASVMGTALHYYAEGVEGERAEDWLDKAIKNAGGTVIWDPTTGTKFQACRQLREMIGRFEKAHGGKNWRRGATLEKELEHEFHVPVGDIKVSVKLNGHPDKIDEQGQVHDLKTGRIRPFAHAAQLGGYTRLAETHGLGGSLGKVPRCVIHHIPRAVSGDVSSEWYRREDCVSAARNSMREAVISFLDFKKGGPDNVLANPRSALCSKLYCPAHGSRWCKLSQQ